MVTIKDGCGATSCCSWKEKLEEAYKRATASVNKIGDDAGNVYYPDGTGYVKVPLPTKAQIDSLAQVDSIKASVDDLNKTVPALEAQVTGVTESLVSNVEVLNGTTAGKFKVRIEREKAALIDSNDYDLSKVNSVELIQGSGPAMVKAQLTLSDGTVLRSDDFLFTTESIGTDVYISSFTFKSGNIDGTISADIGLNNGTTLEANNFVVPTDPSVVSTITDLQTRMTAVENGSGVSGLDALKTTVDTHTSEIAQLTNDVGNLTTSKVNVAQGIENAGKALVVGVDGNVTTGSVSGGLNTYQINDTTEFLNFNFEVGDIVIFSQIATIGTPNYSFGPFIGIVTFVNDKYVSFYGSNNASILKYTASSASTLSTYVRAFFGDIQFNKTLLTSTEYVFKAIVNGYGLDANLNGAEITSSWSDTANKWGLKTDGQLNFVGLKVIK